ncbi:MAG: acetyl-CoA carboxylase biotin carboxyl carrier protein subunit [Saprospirales bacterium]|nr:MAG: acetyl-CoA carboxylase biotin carboxyl carrier protein subunit [Saprospirales bacterium]
MTGKNRDYSIEINDQYSFELSDEDIGNADIISSGANQYHLIHNGKSLQFEVKSLDLETKTLQIRSRGKIYHVKIKDQLDHLISNLGLEVDEQGADSDVTAPMPGLVLDLFVKAGDEVEADDQLLILEAMKMENVIKAPGKGVVDEVKINKSDGVEKGQVLITFK